MKTETYIQRLQSRSLAWLKAKAKEAFHAHIRERDSHGHYFECIACGMLKDKKQMQAGHFYPAGKYRSIEFDEVNVNGECIQCNYYSGDHLIGYKKRIIEKWGPDELTRLEIKAAHEKRKGFCKYTKHELIEIILKYKNQPDHAKS